MPGNPHRARLLATLLRGGSNRKGKRGSGGPRFKSGGPTRIDAGFGDSAVARVSACCLVVAYSCWGGRKILPEIAPGGVNSVRLSTCAVGVLKVAVEDYEARTELRRAAATIG